MTDESEAERTEELRSYFGSCDTNGNGTIQYSEFAMLLRNLDADISPEECRIGFREVDSDRDGVIDFDEFLSWWNEH